MISYSYINNDLSSDINQPDKGLGIYTGIIHEKWTPEHIKPDAVEYMKQFDASTHIPGYTRIGNNVLKC